MSVMEVAEQSLTQAKGDVQEAVVIMQGRVEGNKALYRELMNPLVRTACYEAIAAVRRSNREKVWTAPQHQDNSGSKGVESLANANRSLFDFPLPHGGTVQTATRGDLIRASVFYYTQGRDMVIKANWLKKIAQKVPVGRIAGEVLSEQQLRLMQTNAEKSVDDILPEEEH